ncbi:MAG: IS200/IS605 family element transposase accessory protein TnpB [Methanobacteriota archaeon]|nr:MAG: IS200/IS605 family element transposase accessory protein TnpB [Euryarchaeota archaeon]
MGADSAPRSEIFTFAHLSSETIHRYRAHTQLSVTSDRGPMTVATKSTRVPRAYKAELDPSSAQIETFERHAGASRWVWNWGLARKTTVIALCQLPIERVRIPTAYDLGKEIVQLKRTTHRWLAEISKMVPQKALEDLDTAFKNLYENHCGFPKFKSKKWSKRSFRLQGNCPTTPKVIDVQKRRVRLPFFGWIRVKHGQAGYLPITPNDRVKIHSATVSERAGRWFVSLNVQEELSEQRPVEGPVVGVDLGISRLATVSDGSVIENPKPLRRMERSLKHLQRVVSRRRKGSSNRHKAVLRAQHLYLRITNVRKDALHKATTMLAKTKSVVVVEDLAARGLLKNHRLAKSVADASWSEFVRQLGYKTRWYGSKLVKADRFFPSTKTCSKCGTVKLEMSLAQRTFHCECGLVMDRDLNAAINLSRWPAVGRTHETPVRDERSQVENRCSSMKQEPRFQVAL